jgi:hypothetical protein
MPEETGGSVEVEAEGCAKFAQMRQRALRSRAWPLTGGRAARRRRAQIIIAAAVVVAAGGGGIAAASGASGASRASGASGRVISPARQSTLVPSAAHRGPEPAYYVELGGTAETNFAFVRSSVTGRVTANVRCPGAGAAGTVYDVAAAGNRTFFAGCYRTVHNGADVYQQNMGIYHFRVTGSGHVSRLTLVPGSRITDYSVGELAAAADGKEIVVEAVPLGAPSKVIRVIVIDTRTGRQAIWTWRNNQVSDPSPVDPSLSGDGNKLVFIVGCPDDVAGTCTAGTTARIVGSASRGGDLRASRVIVNGASLPGSKVMGIESVAISPDGSTVTAVMADGPADQVPTAVWVARLSAATGRQLRVLYRAGSSGGLLFRFASVDPTGRFLLLDLGAEDTPAIGWVQHGQLVPVPLVGSVADVGYEAW